MFAVEEEQIGLIKERPVIVRESPNQSQSQSPRRKVSIRVEEVDSTLLTIPTTMAVSSSAETLTGKHLIQL